MCRGSTLDPTQAQTFASEFARAGIAPGISLLDFGFGQGWLLTWAAQNGMQAIGIEQSEQYVVLAKDRGLEAVQGTDLAVVEGKRFDLITAFDVLEHLTQDEVRQFLTSAKAVLQVKTGKILVRVPNGSSPFGRHYQNSDLTHRTAWTAGSLRQLGQLCGYDLAFCGNSARVVGGAGPVKGLVRALRYSIRTCVEHIIGRAFYNERVPMDPNLTAVFHLR